MINRGGIAERNGVALPGQLQLNSPLQLSFKYVYHASRRIDSSASFCRRKAL
jgi:hypothetical protein